MEYLPFGINALDKPLSSKVVQNVRLSVVHVRQTPWLSLGQPKEVSQYVVHRWLSPVLRSCVLCSSAALVFAE
jgi:hypothetical protein